MHTLLLPTQANGQDIRNLKFEPTPADLDDRCAWGMQNMVKTVHGGHLSLTLTCRFVSHNNFKECGSLLYRLPIRCPCLPACACLVLPAPVSQAFLKA